MLYECTCATKKEDISANGRHHQMILANNFFFFFTLYFSCSVGRDSYTSFTLLHRRYKQLHSTVSLLNNSMTSSRLN